HTCTVSEESCPGGLVRELSCWRDDGLLTWDDRTIVRPRQESYGTREDVPGDWPSGLSTRGGRDRDENGPKDDSGPGICSQPQYIVEICAVIRVRPRAHGGAVGGGMERAAHGDSGGERLR